MKSLVLDRLGKPRTLLRYVQDRPGHDRRYALDCSKLGKLGWAPRVAFEKGLEETIAGYPANRAWWQPIKTGEYLEYYRQHYKI